MPQTRRAFSVLAQGADGKAHSQPDPVFVNGLGVQEVEDAQVEILEIDISDGVWLGKTQGRPGPDDREGINCPFGTQTDFRERAEATPAVSRNGKEVSLTTLAETSQQCGTWFFLRRDGKDSFGKGSDFFFHSLNHDRHQDFNGIRGDFRVLSKGTYLFNWIPASSRSQVLGVTPSSLSLYFNTRSVGVFGRASMMRR